MGIVMRIDERGEIWMNESERQSYTPNKPCPECGVIGVVVKWNDATTILNNGPDAEVFNPLYRCNNIANCQRARIQGFGGRHY